MASQRVESLALFSNKTTTGFSEAYAPIHILRTFLAYGTTTAGSGAAEIRIHVSNDNVEFLHFASITLSLSTTVAIDGVATSTPYKHVKAEVYSISGTGAKVTVHMGVAL